MFDHGSLKSIFCRLQPCHRFPSNAPPLPMDATETSDELMCDFHVALNSLTTCVATVHRPMELMSLSVGQWCISTSVFLRRSGKRDEIMCQARALCATCVSFETVHSALDKSPDEMCLKNQQRGTSKTRRTFGFRVTQSAQIDVKMARWFYVRCLFRGHWFKHQGCWRS